MKEAFLEELELTPAEIIERVYRRPYPNRFLASLSPFIAQHINLNCMHDLVLHGFEEFFQRNVLQYDCWQKGQVGCVGSIAFHYKNILEEAAAHKGVRLGKIIKSPMEGLIEYHT